MVNNLLKALAADRLEMARRALSERAIKDVAQVEESAQ
jgi:hypothetical protein